jgi:DNA-binding NarL/FixJ family response regulator
VPNHISAPTDRILDLLSTFSSLRSNNRILVNQIRGTMDELRELRGRLRTQNQYLPQSEGASGDGDLGKRFGLTRREAQVAQLLAQGRSNLAIARDLRISSHTARHHTQKVLSKLEVHSRAEAGAKIRG